MLLRLQQPEGDPRWEELRKLAGKIGNVSEACRRLGLDRSAYYRALRRGRIQSGAPRITPADVKERIVALSLENPEWGCVRISYYLELNGIRISSPTVQKILVMNGLGRIWQRLERLKGA